VLLIGAAELAACCGGLLLPAPLVWLAWLLALALGAAGRWLVAAPI